MKAEMSFQDPAKTDHEEECAHLGDLIGLYCKTQGRGVHLIGAGGKLHLHSGHCF